MDLVRKILFFVAEAKDGEYVSCDDECFSEYDRNLVGYHMKIMDEAGLVVSNILPADNDPYCFAEVIRLTWDGNDFLDSIRSETVWSKVNKAISSTVGTASLNVIKAITSQIALNLVGPAIAGL